jgi:cytochrome c-type biogenesis protein CcmH
MMRVEVRSWLVGAAAGLALASGLAAQQPAGQPSVIPDSVVEARTTALAATLRCPVCQGLSIQDSPSELAQQMRALIKDQVRSGKSDAEVRDYFLSKYGEFILLEPRARGFNLLAYLLPAAVLVAGAVVVGRNVRRWTQPAEPRPSAGEPHAGEPPAA